MSETIRLSRSNVWRKATRNCLKKASGVIDSLAAYWPLTLRQIFYRLVAAGEMKNNRNEYQKLSRVLSTARIDELIPWRAMEDRARRTYKQPVWADSKQFIREKARTLLSGYHRDLMRTHPLALEVWIEKDALSRIAYEVARPYCVPLVVARGFCSMTFKNECRNRVVLNDMNHKKTVILYFGDLDPSGWEMLPAMLKTFREDFGLDKDTLLIERCALTPQQAVDVYELPYSIDAMKLQDPRTSKYKKMLLKAGYSEDVAVELDALPPATLEELISLAIESRLDMAAFEQEQQKQNADMEALRKVAPDLEKFITEELQPRLP